MPMAFAPICELVPAVRNLEPAPPLDIGFTYLYAKLLRISQFPFASLLFARNQRDHTAGGLPNPAIL
ncbi:MAG: hypothetical protein KHY83_05020, partial [Coriobacteriia bacterium]|nr:hypothetical protein [Coriobacteriia bacterium]